MIKIKKTNNGYIGYIPELQLRVFGEAEENIIQGANDSVKALYKNRNLLREKFGADPTSMVDVDKFFDVNYYVKIVNLQL